MQVINRYDGEKYITTAESDAEELRENEYVRIATEEACKMAAASAGLTLTVTLTLFLSTPDPNHI